ncbi:MAG: TetR/AcrR family transcriptional regulator C-terminal domain-containing protein [Sciscionella sp.]
MTEKVAAARQRLTRQRVLQAALSYVDAHGLDALSMHKLGVDLGVKGMSLYSHVASKDALLDGIIEAMWEEVRISPTTGMTWQDAVRCYATSLRELINRHPAAAPLMSRSVVPTRALEEADAYRQVLLRDGFTNEQAIRTLRAVAVYARGSALTEASWGATGEQHPTTEDDLSVLRRVTDMVPHNVPDHLLRLALDYCGNRDPDDQFEFGLELIVCGLDRLGRSSIDRVAGAALQC